MKTDSYSQKQAIINIVNKTNVDFDTFFPLNIDSYIDIVNNKKSKFIKNEFKDFLNTDIELTNADNILKSIELECNNTELIDHISPYLRCNKNGYAVISSSSDKIFSTRDLKKAKDCLAQELRSCTNIEQYITKIINDYYAKQGVNAGDSVKNSISYYKKYISNYLCNDLKLTGDIRLSIHIDPVSFTKIGTHSIDNKSCFGPRGGNRIMKFNFASNPNSFICFLHNKNNIIGRCLGVINEKTRRIDFFNFYSQENFIYLFYKSLLMHFQEYRYIKYNAINCKTCNEFYLNNKYKFSIGINENDLEDNTELVIGKISLK